MTNTTFPRHVFLPPPCKLSCKYDSQIFYVNQRTLQHEPTTLSECIVHFDRGCSVSVKATMQWLHQQPSRCGHETRYLDTYLGWLWVPPSLAWSLVVATQEMDAAAAAEVVTLSSALSHPSLDAGCSPFKNSTKPIKRRRLNKLDLTNKDCG